MTPFPFLFPQVVSPSDVAFALLDSTAGLEFPGMLVILLASLANHGAATSNLITPSPFWADTYWNGNTVDSGNELERKFSDLLQQHVGIVWKVAFAWCRQSADRDDLVQEIHYQLWRAFPKFDASRQFSTWMYRIALNVAISADRRRKRSRELPLQDIPDPQGECGESVSGDVRVNELFDVIGGLDSTNRAMLLLWLEDHSYAQIADILGLSETNVATRLSRLRQKLRTHFQCRSTTKD